MKSAEYVGAVVAAYRRVIDGLGGNIEDALAAGRNILRNDFARKKTIFYFDHKDDGAAFTEAPDWLNPEQDGGTGIPLGTILKVRGMGAEQMALIRGAPLPGIGDSVRLHRADDSDRKSHKISAVEEARGDEAGRWISIPEGFNTGDSVYLIQTRAMSKRYTPVIPNNLSAYKRCPGRDRAPALSLPPVRKNDAKVFPEGFYGMVSRTDDLYVLQSIRPQRALLAYTRRTAAYLLGENKPPLPFRPGEIILVLDPYFPQGLDSLLADEIPRLIDSGYRQFVVNNPGHFSYFRNTPALLIAGPYLYTFNRWALSFVTAQGTDFVVSPLENNRQNLEKTVEPSRRGGTFIPIFVYPALFRIRADLGQVYHFQKFQDSRDESFRLITDRDGSQVYPERPFYIGDKVPFLQESGFNRFILDFSGPPLKKKDYKDIMAAVKDAAPLPNTERFNWKDGFYAPPEEVRTPRTERA
jgi:putative protease